MVFPSTMRSVNPLAFLAISTPMFVLRVLVLLPQGSASDIVYHACTSKRLWNGNTRSPWSVIPRISGNST